MPSAHSAAGNPESAPATEHAKGCIFYARALRMRQLSVHGADPDRR
jgi:hypothetical protein